LFVYLLFFIEAKEWHVTLVTITYQSLMVSDGTQRNMPFFVKGLLARAVCCV